MHMEIKFHCPECGGSQFANIVQPTTVGNVIQSNTEVINRCVGTKRGVERQPLSGVPTGPGYPTYEHAPCGFQWRSNDTHTVMYLEMKFDTPAEYELAIRAVQAKNTVKLLFGGK